MPMPMTNKNKILDILSEILNGSETKFSDLKGIEAKHLEQTYHAIMRVIEEDSPVHSATKEPLSFGSFEEWWQDRIFVANDSTKGAAMASWYASKAQMREELIEARRVNKTLEEKFNCQKHISKINIETCETAISNSFEKQCENEKLQAELATERSARVEAVNRSIELSMELQEARANYNDDLKYLGEQIRSIKKVNEESKAILISNNAELLDLISAIRASGVQSKVYDAGKAAENTLKAGEILAALAGLSAKEEKA